MEFSELAIGIGTLALGIAVLISTGVSNRRNRRVHLADKRKEWLKEFRDKIAELMSLMTRIDWDEKSYYNQPDLPEKLSQEFLSIESAQFLRDGIREIKQDLNRYKQLLSELMLLLFEDGQDTESLKQMNTLLVSLADAQINRTSATEGQNKARIIEVAKTIIDEKWRKIKYLEK
ncbi:hypothetical protein GTQ34_16295 [Muricauda sp. JGD-17]|uniref:Uncharacterized protein n=1 Tax=Flagellimonas ochracea TaxID=2696472 RepID=A0A964WZ14_9FLAO|nr:hypothetical protein [Allomuricauda ochracea]NAY93473.1 hypothetical protein [Allomuricauda ochracea]